MKKPPFKIPSMKEIEETPFNGFKIVSTFTGAGGSCLGYRMAGFEVLWASEFIEAAQKVYRLNHVDTYLDTRDIRDVKPEEILEQINLEKGELDLLDGSPPCASFSAAGRRSEQWGQVKKYSDTRQRVDDLFFEYARILKGLRPKAFVAENVKGLVHGQAKGYFKEILKALKNCGYNVKASVLKSEWLGVPQKRHRVIFIGVRDDLGLNPVFPKPLRYQYTVKDAFKNLKDKSISPAAYNRLNNKDTATYKFWRQTEPGKSFTHAAKKIIGRNTFYTHIKVSPNKPCNTITQSGIQKYHWREPRALSIPEVKRIMTYPDDFKLSGKYAQKWERLGRSVPPIMMYHISKTIRDKILKKIN